MSDYESFKKSVKHWASVNESVAQHEILKGKRKNDNLLHIRSKGRPPNVPFELCPKPRKRCLLRACTEGEFYCMAETPCWRQER